MKFTIDATRGDVPKSLETTLVREDMGYETRTIDIPDLASLLALAESHGGDLVLRIADDGYDPDFCEKRLRGIPHVEIYNGYRE